MPGFYSSKFHNRNKSHNNNKNECDCMTLEKKIEYKDFIKKNSENSNYKFFRTKKKKIFNIF